VKKGWGNKDMENQTHFKLWVLCIPMWIFLPVFFIYANELGPLVSPTSEDGIVSTVPVTKAKDVKKEGPPPKLVNPVGEPAKCLTPTSDPGVPEKKPAVKKDVPAPKIEDPAANPLKSPTPSSNPDGPDNPSTAKTEPSEKPPSPLAPEMPSKSEVRALVDDVLSRMAEAGLGTNLSEGLDYLDKGDFAGFIDFQKRNPEILEKFISVLNQISEDPSISAALQGYVNQWLQEAIRVRQALIGIDKIPSSSGPGQLPQKQGQVLPVEPMKSHAASGLERDTSTESIIKAVAKLYAPIADRISEVAKNIEAAGLPGDARGDDSLSMDFLKDFSAKARAYVLSSFSRVQGNLSNSVLSKPLESTAFAAETAPSITSGGAPATREITVTELYVKNQKKYLTVDSVYIGNDFIYTQKMLHPPANLHPYLKWLLYTRNLTPRMVEKYLATREGIESIYAQAKAGQGNIRYRDKVYGAFLPFSEAAAGNYDLVKPASPE